MYQKISPFVDRVRDYEDVFKDLPELTAKINSVLLPSKYAYSGGVSFAIYETVNNQILFSIGFGVEVESLIRFRPTRDGRRLLR